VELVGPDEQLHPGQLGHALVGDDQGDLLRAGRQRGQRGQRPGRRLLAEDLVVAAVAPLKVGHQRVQHGALVVHHKQDRLPHPHLPVVAPSQAGGRPTA
jgi:hypothetical protein